MKIILTKNIGKYKAGEVEVSEGRARYFKNIGVAEDAEKVSREPVVKKVIKKSVKKSGKPDTSKKTISKGIEKVKK